MRTASGWGHGRCDLRSRVNGTMKLVTGDKVLTAVLAFGLFVLVPAAAHAQNTRFHGCGGPQQQVEPEEIVLACADAKLRVEALEWQRWEAEEAYASGTLTYPDCAPRVPLYRCHRYAHDPVNLRLSQAKYCARYRARVFTLAAVIDPNAPTPSTRFSPFPFRCPKKSRQRMPRRFLGKDLAARLMRTALSRDARVSNFNGYNRRVRCNNRLSRIRIRCKMSWVIGDTSYRGTGMIWLTFQEHRRHWNFAYRVARVNEYCLATGGTKCTDVVVVR